MSNPQSPSRFIYKALRPFWGWILLQVGVVVTWAFIYVGFSYSLKLIEGMLKDLGQKPTSMHGLYAQLWYPISFYLVLLSTSMLSSRIRDIVRMNVNPGLCKRLTAQLVDQLLAHDHEFYKRHFTGGLSNQVREVLAHVPELLETAIDTFLYQVLTFIVTIVYLVHQSWAITISFVIWTGIFLGTSLYGAPRLQELSKVAAQSRTTRQGHITDILVNHHSVRLCNGQAVEHQKVGKLSLDCASADRAKDWFMLKLYTFQSVAFLSYVVLCLYLLCWRLSLGYITTGDFLAIMHLTLRMLNSMWRTTQDMSRFSRWMGNVRQGLDTILAPLTTQDMPNAKPLALDKGAIAFEKVRFSYPEAVNRFDHLDLVLPSQQKIGLVGYSGSGKTTFINLIARLFDPQAGRITIDGQNIRDITQESLRKAISIIPQSPTLFHRSLFDNIHYSRPSARKEEVYEAAKRARAHDFIMEMQQGYDTMVGERGLKISGGQRQRIAIARAMLKDAPILILDESTSQLDAITEAAIQENLAAFMQKKTVLIIAHRLNSLLHTDHILVFDNHRILEQGSHKQLIRHKGLYRQLWKEQIGGFLPEYPLQQDTVHQDIAHA